MISYWYTITLLIDLSRPFMIPVPLSLSCCSLGVVLPTAKERVEDDHRSSDGKCPDCRNERDIDFFGIITFTVTITTLLAAIGHLGIEGPSWSTSGPVSLIFCFILIFLVIEGCLARDPIIPMSLLTTVPELYCFIQALLFFGGQAVTSPLARTFYYL